MSQLTILVVSHQPSRHTERMTRAVVEGAGDPDIRGIQVRASAPFEKSNTSTTRAGTPCCRSESSSSRVSAAASMVPLRNARITDIAAGYSTSCTRAGSNSPSARPR